MEEDQHPDIPIDDNSFHANVDLEAANQSQPQDFGTHRRSLIALERKRSCDILLVFLKLSILPTLIYIFCKYSMSNENNKYTKMDITINTTCSLFFIKWLGVNVITNGIRVLPIVYNRWVRNVIKFIFILFRIALLYIPITAIFDLFKLI